jgi:gas vesicle protein
MKSFLFGLGLGIGLGVLFAPRSGEETRNSLADRANNLKTSARETYEQNRQRVHRGVESIRSTAGRALGRVRSSGAGEEAAPTGTEGTAPNAPAM